MKQAQNEAFVGLVIDNLKVELQTKPYKILKVLEFIVKDLSACGSDFTRLKVCEVLIPALGQVIQRVGDKFM